MLKLYCVTNVQSKELEELGIDLAGVGNSEFSNKYITCKSGENIQHKEKNYSELTFHYWFWKNKLSSFDNNTWIGFCQKRRFWLSKQMSSKPKNLEELKKNLLKDIPREWENFNSVICEPIGISRPRWMKLFKRGWKNIIYDPTILFLEKKRTLKLHFDMHHGYGIIDRAIEVMNEKDKADFNKYLNEEIFLNPHIMFISKKKIMELWFKDLFEWLFNCENLFGLEKLKGYDQQRIYAYLSERYLPFWFKKYSKPISWPWSFFDNTLIK